MNRKSDAWLKQHRSRIGGSNAAAAVGLSPWKTPAALYYEITEGRVEDLENNPDILRGIWLEPICRQRLADDLGMQIIEHDQDVDIRNDKFPWAGATPDGFITFGGAKIPIELKVPRSRNWEKLAEEIPYAIQAQCVHNAAVLGAPAIMLAAMCPETLAIYRHLYEPAQIAIDALMEAEANFWNHHIVPRIPPPPINTDDLKLRWPEHAPGKHLVATEEIEQACIELAAVGEMSKNADERKRDLGFLIKNFLGDAESLVSGSGRVLASWRSHQVSTLDTKRLKDERPEIWNDFCKEKAQRTFLLKAKNLIN